jgi:hypothetical protein
MVGEHGPWVPQSESMRQLLGRQMLLAGFAREAWQAHTPVAPQSESARHWS